MLALEARLATVDGKGVGRWRLYYRAEDMRDARWYARDLVPKCQVRVRDGRTVVAGPRRAEEFRLTAEERFA
jgi:hypothetical protein